MGLVRTAHVQHSLMLHVQVHDPAPLDPEDRKRLTW